MDDDPIARSHLIFMLLLVVIVMIAVIGRWIGT